MSRSRGKVRFGKAGGAPSFRLRYPIQMPAVGPLLVLIYARYSTDEQNPGSIDDQIALCKRFLESTGITNYRIEVLHDSGISGERIFRPGINKVREGIESGKWHLILVEDCSRLFRVEYAAGMLFASAVDKRIRIIAVNEEVDTADEDWEDSLQQAMREHAGSNRRASKRVKRALAGLWSAGAAIGMLRPGYTRKPTHSATADDPERGPFFDEIDPKWTDDIREAFLRAYRNDPAWDCARWMTTKGVPKCDNSKNPEWNDRNFIAFIRRTVYRGLEEYRVTVSQKEHGTGRHRQQRNEKDEVWTREMPHLRIVEDWLWYGANAAIDGRRTHESTVRGDDHPLAGIPRDSRGPLSGIFFCKICGGKMHVEGRAKGGYRCKNSADGSCWNKATALRDDVHANLSREIRDRLLASDSHFQVLAGQLSQVLRSDEPLQAEIAAAEKQVVEHQRARDRLLEAIEAGRGCSSENSAPRVLVQRLIEREKDLAGAIAERDRLLAIRQQPSLIPSDAMLREILSSTADRLLDLDREVGVLLRRIVPKIEAVPYRQFGSDKIVLRAHFDLRVAKLLPEGLHVLLENPENPIGTVEEQRHSCIVDLFDRSTGPEHFSAALSLSDSDIGPTEIGRRLGINKRKAHIAVQFGKAMRQANQAEPFTEVTEQPADASRWRFRST
jgi:DNA invertase Pin-like site-specific DNA recombinase